MEAAADPEVRGRIRERLGAVAAEEGGGMFDGFDDDARRVVVTAQEEARALGHASLGTEHLLLGLLVCDTTAKRALAAAGLSPGRVRRQIAAMGGAGGETPTDPIRVTERAGRVLSRAPAEAADAGAEEVRPEHLLLALLAEGEGAATQILEDSRVEGRRLREDALRGIEAVSPEQDVVGRLGVVEGRLEALEARLTDIERLLRKRDGGSS